jgi:hypothetical protein
VSVKTWWCLRGRAVRWKVKALLWGLGLLFCLMPAPRIWGTGTAMCGRRDVGGPGRALQTMDSGTGKKMRRTVLVVGDNAWGGVGWS